MILFLFFIFWDGYYRKIIIIIIIIKSRDRAFLKNIMPKYNIYDYKYQNITFMIIIGLGLCMHNVMHMIDYMTKMVHQTMSLYYCACGNDVVTLQMDFLFILFN
jgi:hypothetical protein